MIIRKVTSNDLRFYKNIQNDTIMWENKSYEK